MLILGFVLLACFTASQQLPASLSERDDDGSRVYGGSFAKQGEFPWMVALDIYITPKVADSCGGFLISKTHVMTAAHCVCIKDINSIAVRFVKVENIVGIIGNVTRDKGKEVRFDKMYVHKDFYDGIIANDIAILKLETPINQFDENIQSICIANEGKTYPNRQAVVQMGWGMQTAVLSDPTPELKVTFLGEIFDNQTCRRGRHSLMVPGFLCISNAGGEKICTGDSGGPLCIIDGDDKLAVGIVSFDYFEYCEEGDDLPTFYTDIAKYAPWIKQNINDNDICWKN